MKLISRRREKRFCAFCKSPRRVYLKKHVDLTNVLGGGLFAGLVTMAFWSELDPRGLVIFALLMATSELLIHLRWRTTIVCRKCGFDPMLYKRSPERAALKVREFFNAQMENPSFQLSSSPLLELYKKQKAIERKKAKLRASGRSVPMVDP